MALDIQLTEAVAGSMAGIRTSCPRRNLPATIIGSLDKIYAHLRSRGATGLGHNVVIYRHGGGWGPDDRLHIEVGVQTAEPIAPEGEVEALETPAGKAATATHIGPYDQMFRTNQAITAWMVERGLPRGIDWEVYGDWDDDPAKLTTDIFCLVRDAAT
jgi:effector-binding domain-containing protein